MLIYMVVLHIYLSHQIALAPEVGLILVIAVYQPQARNRQVLG